MTDRCGSVYYTNLELKLAEKIILKARKDHKEADVAADKFWEAQWRLLPLWKRAWLQLCSGIFEPECKYKWYGEGYDEAIKSYSESGLITNTTNPYTWSYSNASDIIHLARSNKDAWLTTDQVKIMNLVERFVNK